MTVYIPSPLRSYTGQRSKVEATGSTVEEVLSELDKQFPGIRFRMINEQGGIREHIQIFVNQEPAKNLAIPLKADDVIHIICALTGG